MMGIWMEAGVHMGIGVKLTIDFLLGACCEGWGVWRCFRDGNP
jgi:hypothetical protein